ncbi:spore coat protein U domain-containing protein [Acidipila sp. EB88]|uniref:Csu type fimbrial protein n=1 Tax=Acidipila sp. EB88 TaxID=2305226 RepID=UPI000F5DB5C2|nr:spore coat protein U domain-containing protein [Acidipila sp. EB88]RRA49550.1 hypothetical protein D1Y84_15990 [Acidipila sp. EB88]
MPRWSAVMRRLIVVLCALLGARHAMAAGTCSNLTAQPVNFGNYTSAATTTGGSAVSVSCTAGTAITGSINAGTTTGATTAVRKMKSSAGATINYGLFQDSAHTTNWGNTPGTDTENTTATGSTQTSYVYPLASAGQYVAPGTYTDTVTLTVSGGTSPVSVTIAVTATVVAMCTLSAGPLAFSNYSGSLTTATATLSVTCTSTTTYNVGLDAGAGSGATVSTRLMTLNGATLPYQVFQNSAHSINWGNTVGTDTVAGIGTGTAQSLTGYGLIPAGHLVTPGTYTDTVTATVTY